MPLNYPALTTLLTSLTYRPGLLIPHLVIPTLTSLSWTHAHSLGVRSIVIDKDNCLTSPRSDTLAPDLAQSWKECLEVFGRENVLIVSNSAGCGGETVGAQVVSRNLGGATVLVHPQRKPGGKCVKQVVDYFAGLAEDEGRRRGAVAGLEEEAQQQASSSSSSSGMLRNLVSSAASSSIQPPGHILVIGDRITTDTVLAHRIDDLLRRDRSRSSSHASSSSSTASPQAIAVLTTHLWAYEGAGNALMRRLERWLRTTYVRRGIQPGQVGWRGTAAGAGLGDRQGQWWRQITLSPPEDVSEAASRTAAPAASAVESPPRPPRDPTFSLLLSSSIQRLSFLPSSVRNIFAALVSSNLLRRTAVFFRDGWLLILRGCREGLNRPALVFGSEDAERVERMRRRTGAGMQRGLGGAPTPRRSYSTSTRSTPPPPSGRPASVGGEAASHPQKIPRAYLWGTLGAMVILPAAFLFGTSLSAHQEEVRTGEAAAIDSAVKRDEALARSKEAMTVGEEEAQERSRRRMLGELEKRKYEVDEALGDVERKLVVLRGRMLREREGQQQQ